MPKLAKSLTDVTVRNAKPKDKPYKLPAGRGLHLLIKPDASKFWVFRYRFEDRENTLSMGRYPDTSLAKAEEKVREAHKLLADGVNPSLHRKAEKSTKRENAANSFEVIAREWHASYMKNRAESHKNKVLRRFELYLFPWIGSKAISEITAPQLLEVVKRVEKSGKLETAHRTLQTAGQVFRYAVQTGRAIRDVTADLKSALPPATVKHMAAFTEPKDVGDFLRSIEGYKGTFTVQCALKLAPLVFVRPVELRSAKWSDINLETGEWRYLVGKTQTDHLVPLPRQAIAILKEIQPLSGYNIYVFEGARSHLRPMSESAINAALKRMGYDTQTEITGHGFRAMARTILHERLNIDPHIIEHQLAHKVPDALGRAYNRTRFIEQRKKMMQTWADYLDELKAGAKVINYKNAAA